MHNNRNRNSNSNNKAEIFSEVWDKAHSKALISLAVLVRIHRHNRIATRSAGLDKALKLNRLEVHSVDYHRVRCRNRSQCLLLNSSPCYSLVKVSKDN